MNRLSKILVNPAAVYSWSAALFVAIFFALPFLKYFIDDELVVTLSLMLVKYFCALLVLVSVLTTIAFSDWFRRNWYINLGVFTLAVLVLFRLYDIQGHLY